MPVIDTLTPLLLALRKLPGNSPLPARAPPVPLALPGARNASAAEVTANPASTPRGDLAASPQALHSGTGSASTGLPIGLRPQRPLPQPGPTPRTQLPQPAAPIIALTRGLSPAAASGASTATPMAPPLRAGPSEATLKVESGPTADALHSMRLPSALIGQRASAAWELGPLSSSPTAQSLLAAAPAAQPGAAVLAPAERGSPVATLPTQDGRPFAGPFLPIASTGLNTGRALRHPRGIRMPTGQRRIRSSAGAEREPAEAIDHLAAGVDLDENRGEAISCLTVSGLPAALSDADACHEVNAIAAAVRRPQHTAEVAEIREPVLDQTQVQTQAQKAATAARQAVSALRDLIDTQPECALRAQANQGASHALRLLE